MNANRSVKKQQQNTCVIEACNVDSEARIIWVNATPWCRCYAVNPGTRCCVRPVLIFTETAFGWRCDVDIAVIFFDAVVTSTKMRPGVIQIEPEGLISE